MTVWATRTAAAGDEWWADDGSASGVVTPPDADSYDPTGVSPAWYGGGFDGALQYRIAVDADGEWWVDQFDATMVTLLDRWALPPPSTSTTWDKLDDLPGGSSTSIREHGVGVLGDRVYATGGSLSNVFTGPVTNLVHYYDESDEAWHDAAGMPFNRRAHGCAGMGGTKLYVVGGINDSNVRRAELLEYTESSNSWTSKASLPSARATNAAVVVGTKLYSIGGLDGSGPLDDVDVWDQGTNTWSSCDPLPVPLMAVGAVAVGTDIFVFGGLDGTDYVDTVYKYNTLTDAWTTLGAAPGAWDQPYQRAVLLDGVVYVLAGGVDTGGAAGPDQTLLHSYDPATDTWGADEENYPLFKYITGCGATSTHMYVVCGWSGDYTDNTLYRWSTTPIIDHRIPSPDVQHVTVDDTNVVVRGNVTDAAERHVGSDIVVFDLAGTVLDAWEFADDIMTGGACLTGDAIVFGAGNNSVGNYLSTVDLATGTRSDLGVGIIDFNITGDIFGFLLAVFGIVAIETDLIISGWNGLARIQPDGTPVWSAATHAGGEAHYRGIAHSGNGSVWVGDTDANADEYLYDGTYVQTIVLPDMATHAWGTSSEAPPPEEPEEVGDYRLAPFLLGGLPH